jgi:hypothetical protein
MVRFSACDSDALHLNRLFSDAVVFEEHGNRRLERLGSEDFDFNRTDGDASGRDEDLFGSLRTEAAILSSAVRYAENAKRLAPYVADAHFQWVGTNRLFAEIALCFLDDQHITPVPIFSGHEQPQRGAAQTDRRHNKAEPGSFGEHDSILLRGRFGAGAPSQKKEPDRQPNADRGRYKDPDVQRSGFLHRFAARFGEAERG